MKKTFIYAMMAAAALTSLSLASCSDSDEETDGDIDDVEDVTDEAPASVTRYIMDNIVILEYGDNDQPTGESRPGIYGGVTEQDFPTSHVYEVASQEEALEIFYELIPESMQNQVKKYDDGRYVFSYSEMDAVTRQLTDYTMTFTPGDGTPDLAVIALPEATAYSHVATSLHLCPTIGENLVGTIDQYEVGGIYQLDDVSMVLSPVGKPGQFKYHKTATSGDNGNTSPYFICFKKNSTHAYFCYITSTLDAPTYNIYGTDYYYPSSLYTRDCYDESRYYYCLPILNELRELYNCLPELSYKVQQWTKVHGTFGKVKAPDELKTDRSTATATIISQLFGYTGALKFVVQKKDQVVTPYVHYLNFKELKDGKPVHGKMSAASNKELPIPVMYIVPITNE